MDREAERIDFARFKARIAAPGNLATGFVLPGNGYFFISTTSVLAANTGLLTVGARTISAPAGITNKTHPAGYLEKGKTVIKAGGAPGTVRLFVRNGMGKLIRIGEG